MQSLNKILIILLSIGLTISSCKKFIEVKAPVTSTNGENVYSTDATAAAVLTGIYANLSSRNNDKEVGFLTSEYLFTSLSSDELTLFAQSNTTLLPYYQNTLAAITGTGNGFWSEIYPVIFVANSAIEGLNKSSTLTPTIKQQLLGEARFIRAFCFFNLINLYGDVPLILSSDYAETGTMARTSKELVLQQVIADLIDAKNLLSNNFLKGDASNSTSERVRPTKWAAAALLARAYLFAGEYANAETQATTVISNSTVFSLSSLANAFKMNSSEAIWQLQPVRSGTSSNTGEGAIFILPTTGPNTSNYPVYLSNNLVNSFEPGDQRKTNWVDSVKPSGTAYYYASKYKIGAVNTTTQEYIMVLRLCEQYLIRSEARAKLNNLPGAIADLDVIRGRAGLPLIGSTNPGISQFNLLSAILHERQVELFTEWGHRWFDLKRTGNIDAVMTTVALVKGGSWNPNKALYPLPQSQININTNLIQNTGY